METITKDILKQYEWEKTSVCCCTFTFVPQKFKCSRKFAKTEQHALQMAIDFAEGVV